MNKDPAFLFYSSDFLVGTMLMSNEEIGKYIRILAYMHTKGGYITKHEMNKFCNENDQTVLDKFNVDDDGIYFNERLLSEVRKRSQYTESRRNNRLKANYDDLSVYLIRNNTNGLIKIGSSNKPERRLIELKNQHSEENLEIIASVSGVSQKLESKLHKDYKSKNITNEWFKLSEEDIEEIINGNDMTNHMIVHMENENINSISIKSLSSKNKENKDIKKYGEFENVTLSEEEYQKVIDQKLDPYIERLSAYIAQTGKRYKSHYATILNWSRKDSTPKRSGRVELQTEYKEVKTNMSNEEQEALAQRFAELGGL